MNFEKELSRFASEFKIVYPCFIFELVIFMFRTLSVFTVFSETIATAFVLFTGFNVEAAEFSYPVFPKENFREICEESRQADELLDAGLYARSIPLYKESIVHLELKKDNVDERTRKQFLLQARFHLAQAYYATGSHQEALSLLEDNIRTLSVPIELKSLQSNSLYLKALILKNLRDFDQAKKSFLEYLNISAHAAEPSLIDEARFEGALIDFTQGNFLVAKSQFERQLDQKTTSRLENLIHLYLARIDVIQKDYSSALDRLTSVETKISSNNPLYFELQYLQGKVAFQTHDYFKTTRYFEQALPVEYPSKQNWYRDTLYHLGWSYLKLGDDPLKNSDSQIHYFLKAEEAFKTLIDRDPNDEAYLALAQCYLSKASRLKDEHMYNMAEELLSQHPLSSLDAQTHSLLLRAEAARSHSARDKLYRQLTQEINQESSLFAKGWFLRALNDFNEGQALFKEGKGKEGQMILERASTTFEKAFDLLKNTDKALAGSALKHQALAIGHRNTKEANLKASAILEDLVNSHPDILVSLEHPDEIYYLQGFFLEKLASLSNDDSCNPSCVRALKRAAESSRNKFGDIALFHLAAYQYRKKAYEDAEATYMKLIDEFPNSSYVGDSWYWAACCADMMNKDPQVVRERKRVAFESYADSSMAPEAYFTYYSFEEYLQGDRSAIKHLQNFTKKYPYSPYILQAQHLIGLDYKRDRKTLEGKWIRKKSLTDSIDAFQEVESHFDSLLEKNLIPSDEMDYYVALLYRTILERALANLAIADESQGAKRQIYLEYAEEVFKRLVDDYQNRDHPYVKLLIFSDSFPPTFEESYFWLSQTYVKQHKDEQADQVLSAMLDLYKKAKITRGYFLSRVWAERAQIALNNKEYTSALTYLHQAEDTSKGHLLGSDQKLNLWIQQSACYCGLNQYDDAILILSKVVNDDAVSGLRLKAMYLRAEMYEHQERPELARKQLESLAKKGGEWALKAKEKLEKEYGYGSISY